MIISDRIRSKLCGTNASIEFCWLEAKSSKKGRNVPAEFYRGFKLNSQKYFEGDCVLINVDIHFGIKEGKYEIARIIECYDNGDENYKGFIKVQWFTPFDQIRQSHMKFLSADYPPVDCDREIAKDMWTYENDVDIETISGHCCIKEIAASSSASTVKRPPNAHGPMYICRFLYKKASPFIYPLTEKDVFGIKERTSPRTLAEITNSPKNKIVPAQPSSRNRTQVSVNNKSDKKNSRELQEQDENLHEGKRRVKRKLLDLDEEQENICTKKQKRENEQSTDKGGFGLRSGWSPLKKNVLVSSSSKISVPSPLKMKVSIVLTPHKISVPSPLKKNHPVSSPIQETKMSLMSPHKRNINERLKGSPKSPACDRKIDNIKNIGQCRGLGQTEISDLLGDEDDDEVKDGSAMRIGEDDSDNDSSKSVNEDDKGRRNDIRRSNRKRKGQKRYIEKNNSNNDSDTSVNEDEGKRNDIRKSNRKTKERKRYIEKNNSNSDSDASVNEDEGKRNDIRKSNRKTKERKTYIEKNNSNSDSDTSVNEDEGKRNDIRKSNRKTKERKMYIEMSEEDLSPQKVYQKQPASKRKVNDIKVEDEGCLRSQRGTSGSKVELTLKKERDEKTLNKYSRQQRIKKSVPKTPEKEIEEKSPNKNSKALQITRSLVKKCPVGRTPKSTKKEEKLKHKTPKKEKGRSLAMSHLPDRNTPIKESNSEFEQAKAQLHVSAVPSFLPCREDEFQQIYSFVEGKLLDSTGGCMYVSGVPGTGKTATVREVLKILKECEEDGTVPQFQYLEMNAMKLTKPHQLWVQIWEGLTGQRVTPDHAYSLFEKSLGSSSGPKRKSIFLLLDELDLLWTKKQDVMYNLFDLASRGDSRLIVITIANTMDLPERMMISRVQSRLGLTRMTFQPYTFKQLQEIIASRLQGIRAFDSDAIQLVARKVAAVSGDARRALDICRRATELAELKKMELISSPLKSPKKLNVLVGMSHVTLAINEMFSSPKVLAIRQCSQMVKYLLQAILTEFTRTGIEEALLMRVAEHLQSICRLDGLSPPSSSDTLKLINVLSAQKIIFTEHSRLDLMLRIRLNISTDDVSYALSL